MHLEFQGWKVLLLQSIPFYPPILLCPEAHTATIFRLQETLRTGQRGVLICTRGTSLVVQWLRLHAPSAGGRGSIPGQGARSRMPQ